MKRSLLLSTLLIFLLAGCSPKVTVLDPGAPFKGQPAKKIYTGGRKAMLDDDYESCIKHFEGLNAIYPFGKYSQKAQLDIIYCYYKTDDVGMTLASSDRFIELYPVSQHIPYAYYMRGLSEFYQNRNFLDQHVPTDYAQRDLSPLRKAFLDFEHVIKRYPHSQYAPDARRRMVYIRNTIALHNLEIAKFYYDRHAYVGAANRANHIVKHYQGSTAIPGALVMMTATYQHLGLKKDAQQALNVLKLNFPHNKNIPKLDGRQQHPIATTS
jgi:outer membrane protein assembly factor BamD